MSRTGSYLLSLIVVTMSFTAASETVNPAPKTVTPDPVSMEILVQVALGLGAVLIVIVSAAWMMRRFGRFDLTRGKNLKVVEGLSIGQRERVVLLQVGEKQVLVGVAPGRLETLLVLDKPIETDEKESRMTFAERLSQTIKQKAMTP